MNDQVFCRSDTEYAERPIRLIWQDVSLEIIEITTRWREPNRKAFRVLTNSGQIFKLSYDLTTQQWKVELI